MTTSDLPGRPAATRRSAGLTRLLCCSLLCAAALPAFAQEAASVPAATAASATGTAAMAETAASSILAAPVVSDAMPMPERAMMFAGDINRLIGSRPLAATASEPSTGGRIQSVLKRALALLGTPYRWGGTGTEGFDCSGLVGYVFRSTLGIELPRVSRDMAKSGEMVERAKLSPGDLVFFGRRGRVDHVGIYVGEGQFVHAPRTGRDVTVSRLDTGYWSGKYMEARRVAGI
ncbi:C40 family peptidase [Cognatiluteimonas sedimenti]|uniref:C40 family peptidase n=1 Tax=Cognatiluteimonas sedimenti TaxID=2927791 RepID=UPI003CCDD2B8